MGLFEDPEVHNIKFFIQKDLPDVVQVGLTEAIQAEGGRVETKVPIKGYVLIQPDTPEAIRLRESWGTPERPERHFVPFTWVAACREAGRILRPIFIDHNGDPIRISIHPSIANMNSRDSMARHILHCGGAIVSEHDAQVILADKDTDVFKSLAKHYGMDSMKHVESHLWIKKCIDRGVVFYGSGYKPTGGRRTGDERTAFTEEDERDLCQWIAAVIPYKESGGRTGNKIYQELVSRANEGGYEWVARHTWQSWRERYKKNATRLDEHIAAIVELQQPRLGMKNSFAYMPQPEYIPKKPRKRGRKGKDLDDGSEPNVFMMAGPSNANVIMDTPRADAENEWAIRVGQSPALDWAKRNAYEDAEETNGMPYKRRKPNEVTGTTLTMQAMPFHDATIHPLDQAINDIANEFQFLSAEVRAFYDRTGDMNLTRERFAKMRELINNTL